MDTLIVSFCNVRRWERSSHDGTCIVRINSSGVVDRRFTIAQAPAEVKGATGLCLFRDHITGLLQHPAGSVLCHLDYDLRPTSMTPIAAISRPHSLCSLGETLYAVSTGSDSIVRILGNEASYYWSANGQKEHTIHLNSICADPAGGLYASAFGNPGGPENRHRRGEGYILEFSEGKRVVGGLTQPHSAAWTRNGMVWCDSPQGTLTSAAGISLPLGKTYLRGLALTSNHLYAGLSARRKKSISQSQSILQGAADGGAAEIVVLSWRDYDLSTARELTRIRLPDAEEIFDIQVLP